MLIPFIGYALGRRFIGYVESDGGQLADRLNGIDSIVVRQTFVESFEEDTVNSLGDGEIERSVLYAVEIGGAGEPVRRLTTVRHRLRLQLGPYSVLGLLDARSARQPQPPFQSRGPMIALSDATIGFVGRGSLTLRDVGGLVVNRELLDWVRATEDEAAAFPGVPVLTDRA